MKDAIAPFVTDLRIKWKKMNEFREAIGIPKQRQDRGIKL